MSNMTGMPPTVPPSAAPTTGSPPGTTPGSTPGSNSGEESAKERAAAVAGTAAEQAGEVASTAVGQAQQAAGTAMEQAQEVVGTAVDQSKQLLGEAATKLQEQASEQTKRLTENLRSIARQLSDMAEAGQPGSPVQALAQQAGEHVHRTAGYLEGRQPGQLVEDLQSYARRRPGAFLAAAALGGFAVGRIATAARRDSASQDQAQDQLSAAQARITPPMPSGTVTAMQPDILPGAPTTERYPTAAPGTAGTL